ncbi:hypothetical protein BCR39DRAFT_544785 [Naematelia encephala]|uniref:BRCT domain-containing protein n=1 Tax=Naematelia encephala TaxID=71784 RepID=A0A1Y2ASH4_9TREE|nr:hypothetical protein BCR39DRAFT_544785 [Naematelia encephala]
MNSSPTHRLRSHSHHSNSTRIPLSVSTRSMAKSASTKQTPSSKSGNLARSGTLRRPLGEMATNVIHDRQQAGADNGKRKGKDQGGPPKKMVRYGYGDRESKSTGIPITPRKMTAIPSENANTNFSFKTPEKSASTSLPRSTTGQAFTPARELLRRGVPQEDDEEDSANQEHVVIRAPTPPRAHIDAQEAIGTPKRAHSPDVDMTTPNKRSMLATPSPRKMWEHVKSKTPTSSAMTLQPPATPSSAISPRRAFAGLSRLKAPPSPQPPHLPSNRKASSAATTVPASTFTIRIDSPKPDFIPEIAVGEYQSVETVSTPGTIPHITPRSSIVSPSPITDQQSTSSGSDLAERQLNKLEASAEPEVKVSRPSLPRGDSSMGPPSRIPTMTKPKPSMAALPRTATRSASAISDLPHGTSTKTATMELRASSALPERRPSSRPMAAASTPGPSALGKGPAPIPSDAPQPVRRKPSYPSTLGSGPLARPTSRMVSNPVLPPRDLSSQSRIDTYLAPPNAPPKSPRSVSAPVPSSRLSLSSSITRREGLSEHTSQAMTGLSAALEKLKVKKDSGSEPSRPKPVVAPRASLSASTSVLPDPPLHSSVSMSTSSRLSSIHRPRNSILPTHADASMANEEHAGDRSIAALMCSSSGEGCLKGVVAFVDVFTSEGADSSAVFADMLRSLGARVLSRLTENVTHVVYKSGRPTTLAWWRKQDPPPHIVGISWVTKSKERGERQDEGKYRVETGDEDIFQKRRKSMEPRALMNSLDPGAAARPSVLLDISLAQARRKSMMYAPKISSPLKKAPVRKGDENDEGKVDYFGRFR